MAKAISSLAVGSLVKLGSIHGKPIIWKVADKNHSGYPSNSVTLVTNQIINLMCFDAVENSILTGGSTDYILSNIRQWLNSSAEAGSWYAAQSTSDVPPTSDNVGGNPYDSRAGFLNTFSTNERATMLDTTLTISMYKEGVYGGYTVTTSSCVDKVFLLSSIEVAIADSTAAETALSCFSDHASRIAYVTADCVANSDHEGDPVSGAAWKYWLRDAHTSSPQQFSIKGGRYIKKDGSFDFELTSYPYFGLRPGCNIAADTMIADATDADGCYTLVFNQSPSTPSSITVPSEVYGGKNASISWAASTDADGNLSGYILEQKVDSGAWTQIYKGAALSYSAAVTYGVMTVQYRVKAYDAEGAESAYATSASRTVINNRTPVISGADGDVGSFVVNPPNYEYTVTDEDGDSVAVVEKLDGTTRKSYTATLGASNWLTFTADEWQKILNGSHTLTITATDPKGATATRTITFTKAVTTIEFVQTAAMAADDMPTVALLNVQGHFPTGCTLTVWICNNGNDASPTWEEVTTKARNGDKILFTNTTKTATNWGVKVKAQLLRGSATETCYIQSIGGNFA